MVGKSAPGDVDPTPPTTIIDYEGKKCSGCELLDNALNLLDQIGEKLTETVEGSSN